jgi:hypothetical protein
MKYEDIKINRKELKDQCAFELWAHFQQSASLKVDKDSALQYPIISEDAEKHLRHHLAKMIYGEVNEKAKEGFKRIREALAFNPDPWESRELIREVLSELINYGDHLYKKPK